MSVYTLKIINSWDIVSEEKKKIKRISQGLLD